MVERMAVEGLTALAGVREQDGAKRLLRAALADGPAHAYLFHGPPGVGKRALALAFAGELLGDSGRVEREVHPDLYVFAPLGEQIRVDDIQALRRDLHLRPFEASRRVYIIESAELLNHDASDALLTSLEEPPAYAVVILVASRPQMLALTIRSRCQHVAFTLLSRAAVADWLLSSNPELDTSDAERIARLAGGKLDRAARLVDPDLAGRRERLIELARSTYAPVPFDPRAAMRGVLDAAAASGERARERARQTADDSLTRRELEQRERRAARGAERDDVADSLEILAGWYRDVVAVAAGARDAVLNADRLVELELDAGALPDRSAARAAEILLETQRMLELQVQLDLTLDALFVRLRRAVRPQLAANS